MKFSTTFLTLFATLTSSVWALAAPDINIPFPHEGVEGAVYFLSNKPSAPGNKVFAAEIGVGGTLTLKRAIDTGGLGARGISPTTGPDTLFTSGSIMASSKGNFLVAVNPGSHTVSFFRINPLDPTDLELVGKPVASGGELPVSLTINEAADQVCVLNGGTVSSVSCFRVDSERGLIPMLNTSRWLPFRQAKNGPAGTPSAILFSEDNKQIIASIRGTPANPGYLAVWNVSAEGSLSRTYKTITPPKGALLPFSMTAIPGTNALLTTDPSVGFAILDLVDTTMSSVVPIQGQDAICWSSYSPKTKHFYLTDFGTSTITEVAIDNELKGTIINQYPWGRGVGTIDNIIVSIGDDDYMYILSSNATEIDILSLNGPGQVVTVEGLDITAAAMSLGVPVDRNNLAGITAFVCKN